MSKHEPKITARVREAKGKGLWIFVDREGDVKNHVDDIAQALGASPREDDLAGGVAYAVLPEEIEAIRDACNEWLNKR